MTVISSTFEQPLTLPELREIGLPEWLVHELVANGRLRRLFHGVYIGTEVEDSLELRVTAAAKVIAPGSIVCDRTAAWLHGVKVLGYAEKEVLPPVETCVLRHHNRTRRPGVDGRTRDLLPRDLMQLGPLTVTTPLRTAMDLGCRLKRKTALGALDAFKRLHHLTDADFARELPRFRGRRGVRQLKALLPLSDARAESMRESWTRLAIIDDGLPTPEPQYSIKVRGVELWRLDLAYPQHRIAIEYNGEEWHDMDADQAENDEARRRWLLDDGWIIIVVRKDGFRPGVRGAWLDELAEALRERHTSTLRWADRRPRI